MEPTGGRWLAQEIAEDKHINCLELEAAKLGLMTLCDKEERVHIHLQLDNATAVTFINNMGQAPTLSLVTRSHETFGCGASKGKFG